MQSKTYPQGKGKITDIPQLFKVAIQITIKKVCKKIKRWEPFYPVGRKAATEYSVEVHYKL